MSLKDKSIIVYIIILLCILGFLITGKVKADYDTSNMRDLTLMATYNRAAFLDIDVNELKEKFITHFPAAVYYKGAMCMYHKNGLSSGSIVNVYKIFNVLDFEFEDGLVLYNNRTKD